ncbi:MAG: 50S ribosomal protein L25 [Candidatus Muiribacteriota bacterium]
MILQVEKREGRGKELARKMRSANEIPGIIYGKNMEPVSISFKENEFFKFEKENKGKPIYTIKLDDEEKMVIIKEKQEKQWINKVMHVDFQEIHKGEVIHLEIPIHFHGIEEVEKTGGILVKTMQSLEIACMVKDVPDSVDVDVSKLDIHDSIHLKELGLSEDVKVYADQDQVVCSVTVPRILVDEEEETGEESPEVPVEGEEETDEAAE